MLGYEVGPREYLIGPNVRLGSDSLDLSGQSHNEADLALTYL